MAQEQTDTEKLSEQDFHTLEMARMKRALGQSQLDTLNILYENVMLQVSIKYRLTDKDQINERGEIVRGQMTKTEEKEAE